MSTSRIRQTLPDAPPSASLLNYCCGLATANFLFSSIARNPPTVALALPSGVTQRIHLFEVETCAGPAGYFSSSLRFRASLSRSLRRARSVRRPLKQLLFLRKRRTASTAAEPARRPFRTISAGSAALPVALGLPAKGWISTPSLQAASPSRLQRRRRRWAGFIQKTCRHGRSSSRDPGPRARPLPSPDLSAWADRPNVTVAQAAG